MITLSTTIRVYNKDNHDDKGVMNYDDDDGAPPNDDDDDDGTGAAAWPPPRRHGRCCWGSFPTVLWQMPSPVSEY